MVSGSISRYTPPVSRAAVLFLCLCTGIPRVLAESEPDPDAGKREVVARAGGSLLSAIRSLPTFFSQVLAQLDRVPGNNAEEKARHLVTQFSCLRGATPMAKLATARALVEAGKDLKSLPENESAKEALEIARRYWPTVIRPLGGLDGVFNPGDTGAILSCLSQEEIDGIAHELIVAGVYPIIHNEAANTLASLGPLARRIGSRRIAPRRIAEAKGMAHGTYEYKKGEIRAELESKGKEVLDGVLKTLFRVDGPGAFQEPPCQDDDSESYSRVSLRDAMAMAKELRGFDFMEFGADAIWAKYYRTAMQSEVPELPEALTVPGSQIELRFPEGVPIYALEEALVNHRLPTSLILGVREERRRTEGKETVVRVIEVRPQKTVFGVVVEQEIYHRPDGKYVAYPRIARIFPGSPAERAGLKVGDYFKSLQGREMGKVLTDEQAKEQDAGNEVPDLGVTSALIHDVELQARRPDRSLSMEVRTLPGEGEARQTRHLTVPLNDPCGGAELEAPSGPVAEPSPH